jgi:N-acetylglutamate synthase-like GNAT family acetyltransferase
MATAGAGIGPARFDESVGALLAASGLPVADLAAGVPVALFVMGGPQGLAGVVGMEVLGRQGLLRSLAVAESERGRGLGRELVRHLEAWSVRHGLEELCLLTTTAAEFFARLGYERIARESAPDVARRSEQFASLCPASAVLMRKRLPAAPAPLALAWELAPILSGLRFGIGGSTLLHQLGLEPAPRDLDLVCATEDFAAVVTRLQGRLEPLPRTAHPRYRSAGFAQFTAPGGVEVEVMAGVEVAAGGDSIHWHFDPDHLRWSAGLPCMDPRDWLELYGLFGRPARVAQLEEFLRRPGAAAAPADAPQGLHVASFTPAYRGWFEWLNREWLERWFAVEEKDRYYFADPEATILGTGGAIFMALDSGRPVGTVAAIRHDAATFELAKMAVTPGAQGRGAGRLLVDAVLRFAGRSGARTVTLLSDSKLPAAIRLYERHGFRHAPPPADTGYDRGDVFMVHPLEG